VEASTQSKHGIPGIFLHVYVKPTLMPCSLYCYRVVFAFGLVWSKFRNRLGADNTEKLAKVYHFYLSGHRVGKQRWAIATLLIASLPLFVKFSSGTTAAVPE